MRLGRMSDRSDAIGFASAPFLFAKFSGKMVKEFPLATQFDLGIGPYIGAAIVMVAMGLIGYFGLNDNRRGIAFGVAGAVAVIAMHHQNVRRLFAGTEHRFELRRPRRA